MILMKTGILAKEKGIHLKQLIELQLVIIITTLRTNELYLLFFISKTNAFACKTFLLTELATHRV